MDAVPKNGNLPEKLEFSRNLPIFSSFSRPFLCVYFAPLTTSAATELQMHGNTLQACIRFQLNGFVISSFTEPIDGYPALGLDKILIILKKLFAQFE